MALPLKTLFYIQDTHGHIHCLEAKTTQAVKVWVYATRTKLDSDDSLLVLVERCNKIPCLIKINV